MPGLATHARGLKTTAEALYLRDHFVEQLELANIELKNRHYAKSVEYLQKALSIEKTDAVEDFLARVKTMVVKES